MGVVKQILLLLFSSFCLAESVRVGKFQVHIEYYGILKNVIPTTTQDKFLNLSRFELEGISPEAFNNVKHINSLALTLNKIFNLSKNVFSALTNLEHLTIRNIGHPDTIKSHQFFSLKKLKVLDLSKIWKIDFDYDAFAGLPDDCELRIDRSIEIIKPKHFGLKQSVQIASHDLAKFQCTTSYPYPLQNLLRQEEILFNENKYYVSYGTRPVVCIFEGILEQLVAEPSKNCVLTDFSVPNSLILNRLGIKSFKKNWYRLSTNYILELLLKYNRIECANVLNDLPDTINTVSLQNNRIRIIKNYDIRKNTHVQKLDLSFNDIKIIEYDAFKEMRSLKDLDLSYNKIGDLNFVSSLSNTKLLRLNLMENNISVIPKSIFSNLGELYQLDLSFNNVKKLTSGSFDGLRKLSLLDLHRNVIEKVYNKTFDDLRCLRNLNFFGNKIRTIEKGFAKNMNNLQLVDLSGPNRISKFERGLLYGLPADSTVLFSSSVKMINVGVFRNYVK